ncbi:pectinesterase family protein [Arsukibacterium indicum]|uniref:Pectinesterase catalytic domain-containing protein n=1 Tax=Arsukibacterium indicum TaxID=2848612 RepID=A0ABS6MLZ5_9GAMM|nr:pectinesterase family protein [Arsukibacterium indicum]MBV2129600.1 hypothetical protein [Arsukibacterium indicum]
MRQWFMLHRCFSAYPEMLYCCLLKYSLLTFVLLFCPAPILAQQLSLQHYPQYQCLPDQSDNFCQSFTDSATGLSLLAGQGAAPGQPNGQFSHNLKRQTLVYKAGRIGGKVLTINTDAANNFQSGNFDSSDFFYEALVRPFANSTTDRHSFFLTMKVVDSDTHYGAGFVVGTSIYTSKLELATIQGNDVQVLAQQPASLILGKQDDIDGQWYLLRAERRSGSLQLYLDGQLVLSDDSIGNQKIEQLGIWSFNRSFELDFLRVGKPAVPSTKTTSPHINLQHRENQTLSGYQFESSEQIEWQVSGATRDDIELINLTPELITLSQQAATFRINYRQPGQAGVLLRSKSQPHVFKQLHINVLPALTFPAKTRPDLLTDAYPAINAKVPADTLLRINLAEPFVIADSGAVRIYQVLADNQRLLVDEIRVNGESDTFGKKSAGKLRAINREMLWRNGNTLLIKPHGQRLEWGKRYQVVIAADTVRFVDPAKPFAGVGFDANWSFSTKAKPRARSVMQVAAGAAADFSTVQGAFNFVMNADDGDKVHTIKLAAGRYFEPLYLYGVANLTLEGAGAGMSQIEFSNYDSLNSGLGQGVAVVAGHTAGGRSLFLAEDVGQLTLKQLSITNLHQRQKGVRNQAETVYFNGTGKLLAVASNFISEQDTLMLKGTSYLYRCLIAGNVDFIWGQNYLSLFEQNEIRSVGNSVAKPDSEYVDGSYILQARSISSDVPGFIFINNRFTSQRGPTGNRIRPGSTFLARSAGRPAYFDQVLMLNNQLGGHIAPAGWAGPVNNEPVANPAVPDSTRGWREYGSTDLQGKPLNLSHREYGIVLTPEQLPYQNSEQVLQQHWPGFNPEWLRY